MRKIEGGESKSESEVEREGGRDRDAECTVHISSRIPTFVKGG